MKKRDVEITLHNPDEALPLRIVSDAMIATSAVGEGRMIPLLILDTSKRPDVEELVRVHEHVSPGDAESMWTHLKGDEDKVTLVLCFIRPMELTVFIEFDVLSQGGLVDRIVAARALYIQPGRDGDRFASTMDSKRIIVEVPETGFDDHWNKVLRKVIFRDYRARGLSRSESKLATERFIREWRGFTGLRVKS